MDERELLFEKVLDSITAHLAVLDQDGQIIFVNSAWKTFARENGSLDDNAYLGFDYLAVCRAAIEREHDESAAAALQGIREVLEGARKEFSMVYPCHSPDSQRWFIMRVSSIQKPDSCIVIAHNDITWRKQAEQMLQVSEEKYRNLFENMAAEVHLWQIVRDQDGNIQTWRLADINPAGLKAWGKTLNETVGKTPDEIFPGAMAFFKPIVQKIFKENSPHSWEAFYSGRGQYLKMTNVPFGEYFISTGMDVTEHKQKEEELLRHRDKLIEQTKALQESEERLRALVDASSDILYRMSPNWEEMSQFSNRGFLSEMGKPERAWRKKYIHPEDQPQMDAAIQEALRTKSMLELEHRVLGANGSLGWMLSRAVPLMDAQGEIVEWFGAASNITSRKHAELALIKEQAFLERVMETVPSGVFILDTNGKISYANSQAERILGLSQVEIIKQTYNDPAWKITDLDGNCFPDEELPFSRVMSTRMPVYDVQHAIEWPDGKRVILSINAVPLLNNEGTLEGMVAGVTDITALKQAEKRIHVFSRHLLNVREHERRQISTALHHDLGSITIGVTSRLHAAKDDIRAGRSMEALQALEDGECVFTEAIRHLKKLAIELRPPDLDILGLQSALRQYFAQASKGTSMKISFSDTSRGMAIPPDIQTIIFRIAQECLNNIIQHADALHARVRLSASKGMLKLSFSDDGRGFNQESLVANMDNHLGILTMQEMIKDSGGEIKIESTLGKGSKVSITVPLNMESDTGEVTQ